ncbi:hypothetical protein BABINDRAFT_30099 [Babjeviella inositovora NRRL Y-12698]|uniref:Uridine kinase n=1 Tax=Babjeviella inositovora NRRL Y-12698 TaxID=984486 RepID=A0A1E3QZ76_9ASCO|nr:uncharacterized protein BABINDRAFT_30099 [Babjeviella inositovora NRRL Y-12698]ODQ82938.1 hypothetical protein BABINDRAFT_30099 [Babjeviella inositovora NRRL Y-12698]
MQPPQVPERLGRRKSSRIVPADANSFINLRSPSVDSVNLAEKAGFSSAVTEVSTPQSDNYIPPWTEPYIIGIAGISGSGKTTVAQKIIQEINQPWTVLLSLDNFYNPLSPAERQQAFACEFDFDVPESLDLEMLFETVKSIKEGRKTTIPVYSFEKHNRTDKSITIYGANVIIIEGIYALFDPKLLALMDTKIYVDTDLDVCLARRLTRDILHRKRDLAGALKQWNAFVKPAAVKSVRPCMNNADVILPRGSDSSIAINMIIQHIQKRLDLKSKAHLQYLKRLGCNTKPLSLYKNLSVLKKTNQNGGIHSILCDSDTSRSDFIFYFNRISLVLINKALDFLDYTLFTFQTPGGHTVSTVKPADEVIAVSIIRSGDCFMASIKKTFPEISIGKLLIQSDTLTGEPQLHMESLPKTMGCGSQKIFLFDAQLISGAASIMATQVLLDHDVKIENIVLVCYLSTEIGVRRVLSAFPGINIVAGRMSSMGAETSSDDEAVEEDKTGELDTDWWFRNRFIDSRYFGTD